MAFILRHLCVLSILLPDVLGAANQLTFKEYERISLLLTREVDKKYPAGKDEYSDTVKQARKGNLTIYHRGDEDQPVFISTDEDKGKKIIVIKRGEDYVIPEDKQTFIVLKQKSGNEYNVHTAIVYEMGRGNEIVVWGDARIEQQENVMGVLNVLGSRYLPRRRSTDKRPRCEWIASVLFCNAKKTVPAPKRKFPPPPDKFVPPKRPEGDDGDDWIDNYGFDDKDEKDKDNGGKDNKDKGDGDKGDGDKGDGDKGDGDKGDGDKGDGDKGDGDKGDGDKGDGDKGDGDKGDGDKGDGDKGDGDKGDGDKGDGDKGDGDKGDGDKGDGDKGDGDKGDGDKGDGDKGDGDKGDGDKGDGDKGDGDKGDGDKGDGDKGDGDKGEGPGSKKPDDGDASEKSEERFITVKGGKNQKGRNIKGKPSGRSKASSKGRTMKKGTGIKRNSITITKRKSRNDEKK